MVRSEEVSYFRLPSLVALAVVVAPAAAAAAAVVVAVVVVVAVAAPDELLDILISNFFNLISI